MIKISFIGPESSGKSTLSLMLSKHLKCKLVTEYAREYLKGKTKYSENDLKKIAEEQSRRLNNAKQKGEDFLVADTCLIDIEIWSEVKFKTLHTEIKKMSEEESFEIYFLCKPDIPWKEDPLRENPNNRNLLYNKFKEKLSNKKINYFIVKGNLKDRFRFCLDIISRNK